MSESISVAICTYNGARYVREQLESIANQTQLPDEVVICDDVSEDDTLNILNDFASQGRFAVRIVANSERLGPARNFEKGDCSLRRGHYRSRRPR